MKTKKPSKKSAPSDVSDSDLSQIKRLLGFMAEHNLEEFEYARGDLRIRLRKPSANSYLTAPRAQSAPEIVVAGTSRDSEAAETRESAHEGRLGEDLHTVKSPIVGTYYEAPTPGGDPFVKVGDHVLVGQTLC